MRYYKPYFLLCLLCMAISNQLLADDNQASEAMLKKHVYQLADTPGFRNYRDTLTLNRAAAYIHKQFAEVTKEVYTQDFTVKDTRYHNVYATFGPPDAPRIIVGAHYDAAGDKPGADDNASGVAGLLELARMLAAADKSKWEIRIDLVAYSLEEPPHFATQNMGSFVHATAMYNNKVPVVGMVCLEMIGYFDDNSGTQSYPLGILKMFYGGRGDYITLVRKHSNGRFPRLFTRAYKKGGGVKTKVFKGPRWVKGTDLSDHRNYWKYGWPALMITDTAFFRNKNYHTELDTPDTLDYFRMASVVNRLYKALTKLVV